MAPTAARACLCACIALGLCSMALAAGSSPSPPAPAPSPSSSTPAPSPSSSSPPSSSSSTTKSSSSPGRSASASLALLGSATALGFMSAGRAPLVVLLVAAAMLQGAAAQVSEQETTLPSTTDIIATKPKVDCSVTWSETWTKCSPDGTQSRRYTVDVYPTRAGKQCPPPETRPCTYPGPETIMVDGSVGTWGTKDCAQRRKMLAAYTGESHESFTMSAMCQYAPLKVTVGDVVVFKKASPSDDVFMLPSQWHYAVCNFTDGGSVLPADALSSDTELRYTIRPEDKDKRLYLGSSRADACSMGQRILISVDDFKQGTLAEALDLLNKKEYETEEGAQNMIERIWCFEDHCPTPALGFYEGNLEWAKERCVADAYSLLGFVYRKKPKPEIRRAETYYRKALELVPKHCEATSYMGELYIQINDFEQASDTLLGLQSLAASEKTAACTSSLAALEEAWKTRGWCPPPANLKTPCLDSAAYATTASGGVAVVAALLSAIVAMVF